jgi:hypothetical protein
MGFGFGCTDTSPQPAHPQISRDPKQANEDLAICQRGMWRLRQLPHSTKKEPYRTALPFLHEFQFQPAERRYRPFLIYVTTLVAALYAAELCWASGLHAPRSTQPGLLKSMIPASSPGSPNWTSTCRACLRAAPLPPLQKAAIAPCVARICD